MPPPFGMARPSETRGLALTPRVGSSDGPPLEQAVSAAPASAAIPMANIGARRLTAPRPHAANGRTPVHARVVALRIRIWRSAVSRTAPVQPLELAAVGCPHGRQRWQNTLEIG